MSIGRSGDEKENKNQPSQLLGIDQQLTDSDLQNIFLDVYWDVDLWMDPNEDIVGVCPQLTAEQIKKLQSCQTREELMAAFISYYQDIPKQEVKEVNESWIIDRKIQKMKHLKTTLEMMGMLDEKHEQYEKEKDEEFFVKYLNFALLKRLDLATFILEIRNRAKSKEKKEQRAYTQSSTPQLDINRAISGDPQCFIKTAESTKRSEESKIIINTPAARFLRGGGHKELFEMLSATTSLNLYVYHQGDIVPFTDIDQISIVSSADIRKILSEQHKNVQDYYILDYYERNKIFTKNDLSNMDSLDEMRSKFYVNLEYLGVLDSGIVSFLKDSIRDGDLVLSMGSQSSSLKATELLRFFGDTETVSIGNLHGSSGNHYELNFPKESKKIKSLKINLWHCNKIDLNNLASLENLELDCKELVEIDLRALTKIRFVKLKTINQLQKMFLRPDQKNIVFDLRGERINDGGEKIIKSLRDAGVTVLLDEKIESRTKQPQDFFSEKIAFDKETGRGHTERSQNISLINHEGDIDPCRYRKKIITHVQIDQKTEKLCFMPFVFNEEKAERVDLSSIKQVPRDHFNKEGAKALHEQVSGSYLGIITLSEDDPWIPLTGLTIKDELVLLDEQSIRELEEQKLQLEVRYAHETQQYFVKVVKMEGHDDGIKKVINLHYAMSPSKKNSELKVDPVFIPDDLERAIKAFHSFDNFGEDELEQYCSDFVERDISDEIMQWVKETLLDAGIENTSIHDFMSALCAKAGVCRHRSMVFMVLANYLKIPARVNDNGVHMFVEYFEGGNWKQLDLGGGHVDVLNTTNSWEEQTLQKHEEKERAESVQFVPSDIVSEEKIPIEEKEVENEFKDIFEIDELILDEGSDFTNWYQALREVSSHPLLEFKRDEQAFDFHSHLIALENLGENYFYIHQPSDFERLLKQLEVKENGQCDEIKGPLLKMIEKGGGTILINWSQFTDKQIAIYKSILDSSPTLQGHKLSPGTKIISITQPGTEACSAFYSRTKKVAWPKTLSRADIPKPEELKAVEEKAIDLYQSRDWENILVGKLQIMGDSFSFKEGALLKALKNKNNSICLTGLPDDLSFQIFLERLQREKGFYANGIWHKLPNDFAFRFSLVPDSPDVALLDSFSSTNNNEENIFYINQQNFHQFFERYTIDGEGKVNPAGGLLAEMPSDAKLVMTDQFSEGEMRRLQAELVKYPGIKLLSLSNVIQYEVKVETLNSRSLSISSVVLTEDVDSAARAISKSEDKVVDISTVTEFSDLFENTILKTEEKNESLWGQKKLRFNHEIFELLQHLEAGGTIILKGSISSELYHQLETLFCKPPYLIVNGEHKKINGTLILITPENKNAPHLFDSAGIQYKHEFSWEKAQLYLMREMKLNEEEAKEIIDKIQKFYQIAAEIKHTGKTTPPELILTEDRVLKLAEAMKRNLGKGNPIKEIFHQNYTEDKENYARLSVMAKVYLSDSKDDYDVDQIKLNNLLLEYKGNRENIKYQIVNCFSPSYLKQHFNQHGSFDDLVFFDITGLRIKTKSSTTRDKKQIQLVHDILQYSPFVELRGTPGTGKTHFIEHELKDRNSFWGEEKIIDWLTEKGEPPHYLLLDEANMKEPGYWDFLKGLKTGEIYYKGKFYPISPDTHKVIFTGNPENYPGRHYHSFLQQVPKVYFKSHTDAYLSDNIIKPLLSKMNHLSLELQNEITRCFIAVYHLAKKELPFETIGIRDIKSMLDHFSSFMPTEGDAQAKACLAGIEIFAGLFKKDKDRNIYIESLINQFGTQPAAFENLPADKDDYILPSTRQLLWNNANHCLARREKALQDNSPLVRTGFLVEGPSGIGKSEMMLQTLKKQGFLAYDEDSKDLEQKENTKVYFHITIGSENISEIILKAFHLGAVVIIDELNLLTQKDEELLTHLLEGRTPSKQDAEHLGFFVLASQNSQLYAGRKPLSYALLSRLDRFYEMPYTKEDLLEIASKSGKFDSSKRAEQFVDRFWAQHTAHSENINVRNFFLEIKRIPGSVTTNSSSFFNRSHSISNNESEQPHHQHKK
jgi:hypothetical protein